MAVSFNDLVYTKSFTPREYQVELLYAAKEKDIIVCLGKYPEQTFIVTKLIQELSYDCRRSLEDNGKRIIYVLRDAEKCKIRANYIQQLTDLTVALVVPENISELSEIFKDHNVLVTTVDLCAQLITDNKIRTDIINLVIIDQCHKSLTDENTSKILQTFPNSHNVPRKVGLAVPLFKLTDDPGRLGFEIERLEKLFHCDIETASDVLSILRYSPKPKEYVIEYKEEKGGELYETLKNLALDTLNFMTDHRYDPSEIYSEEFLEDIQKIPSPIIKPCEMIHDFLTVLDTLGPWCADWAALSLLISTEKLKIKTPYERHYLLLNVVATLFIKIRAVCDNAFEHMTEKERIYQHSTTKVHRILQILKTFTPFYKDRENSKVEEKRQGWKNKKDSEKREKKEDEKGKEEEKEQGKKKEVTTTVHPKRWRHSEDGNRRSKFRNPRNLTEPDVLCGVIFVNRGFIAKILFNLLNEASKYDDDLHFLSPLYTTDRNSDNVSYLQDIEIEHRKQEEVLKRFRIHECNLLIATSILEEGIDIPKCNFVMRYDFPKNYQSYVQCKSRARAVDALHILLIPENQTKECVWQLSQYHYTESILLQKCSNYEPRKKEEMEADLYSELIPHYKPLEAEDASKVNFNTAISLINRYCAKLPSDTFTRLTPECSTKLELVDGQSMFSCSLRLPINSPLKYVVTSYLMPNKAMARRMAALQMCVHLHKNNELDDNLAPIGKENFKAKPEDAEVPALPDETWADFSEARPGTTKRRQYYYKKAAESLTDCRPVPGVPAYLYHIHMVLTCPLPEEQNTRGRRIYPPEDAAIGFGILTLKKIPKLCPFPIYTRSGEVHVQLKLSKKTVILTESEIDKVVTFLKYTFTNVLRLQKYLMMFDYNASENSYIIVPVKKETSDPNLDIAVHWEFLNRISENQITIPTKIPDEERTQFKFDSSTYHDAVIMPWYRNQDQPQYFYVAEICTNLSPKSSFPGDDYSTFEEYYLKKYKIQIQNLSQPLLDVDHTSARLNFLTPRYVNRKGVALPTSSEETKRAKRENLEQKQILVAELCAVHPFPASLWRQAVCLPCILYRINALLLADKIRCQVAEMINLGRESLEPDFEWKPLDFGWSLAEVLKNAKESERNNEKSKPPPKLTDKPTKPIPKPKIEEIPRDDSKSGFENGDELEIGTWSNDMAINAMTFDQDKAFHIDLDALENDEFKWGDVRYGSPVYESDPDNYDSDETFSDDLVDTDMDTDDDDDDAMGLKISYMSENVAEAVEDENELKKNEINRRILNLLEQEKNLNESEWTYDETEKSDLLDKHRNSHFDFAREKEKEIINSEFFISSSTEVLIKKKTEIVKKADECRDFQTEQYIKEVAHKFKTELVERELKPEPKQVAVVSNSHADQFRDKNLFSFDRQPELEGHPGPSPSLILQALTMSNANDGINLERLETIGDSFLKYAITTYLYCTYENIHEGKLSHLRSKQVSNLNLYRLGRQKVLGESMIATKFEPHDNWLPPCYYVPRELEQALIESGVPSAFWNQANIPSLNDVNPIEINQLVKETEQKLGLVKNELDQNDGHLVTNETENYRCFIPYNLITQHSIPDKSIADCVEALIGAYLIACGPRGALLFMAWLGIHVLPTEKKCFVQEEEPKRREPGSTPFVKDVLEDGRVCWTQICHGILEQPQKPLLRYVPDPEKELEVMLDGYNELENFIGYKFQDRSYLLQAFTHASYQPNRLTDCYQRLEFLGDAVLDYLITRHLYEDSRQHSPGALTDLRSALVNNTIFASLAVRCGFHKYFRHLSPGLNVVIDRFVRIQEENGHSISEEYYLIGEEKCEEAEDVEVPKALGDVFESLAGAVYLDSGMSLDAVWAVYYQIMKNEIEQFSTNVPKSPIRELLELEPETAKFGKPEKLADGRRVRVIVDVFGKGSFKGIGRNYRIAKCTAAKCALKKLKKSQNCLKNKF